MVRTETFLLPVHWAPYLINGDESGYSPEELLEISEWEISNSPGPCIGCENYSEFCWRGDDGPLGAERTTYTFQVLETCAAYADGEVVAWH